MVLLYALEKKDVEGERRKQKGGRKRRKKRKRTGSKEEETKVRGKRKERGREGNRKRKRTTPLLQGRQHRATVKERSFSAPSSDWGLRCPNSQLVATASTLTRLAWVLACALRHSWASARLSHSAHHR